jgi:hypothetical protein
MEETKQKVLNEVKGVAYIGFKVSDVKRSVPWYVTNLGCEIRQQADGLAICLLPWGPDIELNKANLMYDPDGIEIPVWGGYKREWETKPDNWID